VNELHVEGGARLFGALLQAGLVDEVLAYLAPRLLGPGRGMADLPPLQRLADSHDFRFVEQVLVGSDLRLRVLSAPGGVSFGIGDAPRVPSESFTDAHPRE
ncbi:MAG: dihydrofolate reductase family protein, partial [Rubrivivax sp.]|nr:dihydrofolate reductase family protein [Rubrivivax sp.]